MKRWLAGSSLLFACLAIGLLCSCTGTGVGVPPEGKPIFAALPVFDPPAGSYPEALSASIACGTEGASIYYTMDGSDPTDSHGTLYVGPIEVRASLTIKAAAYAPGSLPSGTIEAVYIIAGNAAPVIHDAAITGVLRAGQAGTVSVRCNVTDGDGSVKSVTVDLTDLGGASAQPLSTAADGRWSWSGHVQAPTGGPRKVVITAMDNKGATAGSTVYLDVASPAGGIVWEYGTQGTILSSPAIAADGTVYIGSSDGSVYAITSGGGLKWSYPAGDAVTGCPAVGPDGTVYFGAGESLYALDSGGRRKWSVAAGAAIHGGVAIGGKDTLYVGTAAGTLLAVRADGVVQWRFSTGSRIEGSPSVDGQGILYFGADNGILYALWPAGRQKWKVSTGGPITASPAIGADGTIYVGSADGNLYAIRPDGTSRWVSHRGDAVASSAAIGADGTLYVGSNNARLSALDAAGGGLRWEFPADAAVVSSPAVAADGTVCFASTRGTFYAVDSDGSLLWSLDMGSPLVSSPAIGSDGMVYIGGTDRHLYALTGTSAAASSAWPTYRGNVQRTGAAATSAAKVPPQVVRAAAVGSLVAGRSGMLSVTCDALDFDSPLTGVVADLTTVGGPAGQALAKGANDQWSGSATVSPPSPGTMRIPIIVTDADGATATTETTISVMAAPALTGLSVTGPLARQKDLAVTVSCTADDADGSVQTVVADLSAIGGSAAVALSRGAGNQWSWSGTVTPALVGLQAITFTATDDNFNVTAATVEVSVPNSPPTFSQARVDGQLVKDQARPVTVSCRPVDPDGTVHRVTVNFEAITGVSQEMVLTSSDGVTWAWSGLVTPSVVGACSVALTATDQEGGQTQIELDVFVHALPVIDRATVTPSGPMKADQPVPITVRCDVTPGTQPITTVVVDLSGLGGSAYQILAYEAGNTWAWSGQVLPGRAGDIPVTFSAADSIFMVERQFTVTVEGSAVSNRWLLTLGGPVESSPAVAAGGTIYCGASDGNLYAVKPDGQAAWSSPFATGGAIRSSPAIGPDGAIYVGSDDRRLYAINPDGTQKWTPLVTGGSVFSSPAIGWDGLDPGEYVVYVGSDDRNLYAVKSDGSQAWPPLTLNGMVRSSPAVAPDGTLYVGTLGGTFYAVNPGGTVRWSVSMTGPVASSPAIGPAPDHAVYVTCFWPATLYALNPADGSVLWSQPLGATGANSSPIVGPDGTVYVGAESDGGKLVAFDSVGKRKWECLVSGLVRSTAAIGSDGTVYVGTNGGAVYAVHDGGGGFTVRWTFQTGAEVRSSPALTSAGVLYFGSLDANLYAVNASAGSAASSWPMFRGGPQHTGAAGP